MKCVYTSKYGKIVKQCPGLNEYWYKGHFIAGGSIISGPNPEIEPTREDWEICVSLRQRWLDERQSQQHNNTNKQEEPT